jgi:hypothetical protein
VSVWEDRGTETAVRNEAKAIVDLHHVSAALPFEAGVQIRHLVFTYTDHVRKYEWRTPDGVMIPRTLFLGGGFD